MNISMTIFNADRFITFKLGIPITKPSLYIIPLLSFLIMAKPMVLSTFTNRDSEILVVCISDILQGEFCSDTKILVIYIYLLNDSQTACWRSSEDINGLKIDSLSLSMHSLWWYLFIKTVS